MFRSVQGRKPTEHCSKIPSMQDDLSVGEVLFHEEQRPSAFVVKLVSGVMGLMFVAAFALVPVSPWLTGVLASLALVFVWWIRATKLVSEVSADGLRVRMAPFGFAHYPKADIEGWRVHMTYPWGVGVRGWSVKKSPGVTVYLAGSAPGIVVGLKGHQGLWLSSRRPEELAKAMTKAIPRPGAGSKA